MNSLRMMESIKQELQTVATIGADNAAVFTVRGWPFAVIRNGNCWDVLGPNGLKEAWPVDQLAEVIREQVLDLEADEAGWDFDPEGLAI